MTRALSASLLAAGIAGAALAQQVQVETFTLPNGMKFLLVPRTDQPNVIAAGWVAKVGSANERPGITGISHFFEHMMFKGTNTIGTASAERDRQLRDDQKEIRDRINQEIWGKQYQRYYAGQIDDPWDPANDTDEIRDLRRQLKHLMDVQQGKANTSEIQQKQAEIKEIENLETYRRQLADLKGGTETPGADAKVASLIEKIANAEKLAGEDPAAAAASRRNEIEALKTQQEADSTIIKDEFDKVYTGMGGSGMNAFTSYDLTFYFINVPSNKFELWAWMESDRLSDSVFREFYSERDVVHEERRLRTESTPTGIYEEEFEAMFWQSSPYLWPVIGWPSDLNSYTIEEAQRYWDIYYKPNNLTGVVVGDFNPDEVKPLISSYFGRLERGKQDPPPVVTLEIPQKAQKRMYAECDCQPQIEVRYHTVPFGHADSFALEILANVLNGRTGRLYKSMVEGDSIASDVGAFQDSRKYAGGFSFFGETKGDATPEQIEQGWYNEIAKLQKEAVPDHELQKVKNQLAANSFRRLQSNFFLLLQLGRYEGMGDWEYINTSPAKLQAVTADDILRVAQKYFTSQNRCVAIYTRKAGSAPADPELEGLNPQEVAAVKMMSAQLAQAGVNELQDLKATLATMESRISAVPADRKKLFEISLRKIRQRVDELQAEADAAADNGK